MARLSAFVFFLTSQAILFNNSHVLGQDVSKDVFQWTIALDIDLSADSTASAYNSYFVTYGQNKIEWITKRTDKKGQTTTTTNILSIISVKGSWKNVNDDGGIEFGVTMNKSEGTFRAKKSKDAYSISVNLAGKTGGKLVRDFKIRAVGKL
jgi:hypothetical protein